VKVVFDTTIPVSAIVFPSGRGEAALRRTIEGRAHLVLSKPTLDELLGILARKLSRDAEDLAHVAVFLADLANYVKPRWKLQVVKDDPSVKFVLATRYTTPETLPVLARRFCASTTAIAQTHLGRSVQARMAQRVGELRNGRSRWK
jgi:predicted nucleic acid-binding protein